MTCNLAAFYVLKGIKVVFYILYVLICHAHIFGVQIVLNRNICPCLTAFCDTFCSSLPPPRLPD